MLKFVKALSVLLGIAVTTLPAQAQTKCTTRTNMVTELTEKYGEVNQGVGIQSAQQLIEVWSSKKTGSWTIIASHANGMSCIMATGHNWTDNPKFSTAFDERVGY